MLIKRKVDAEVVIFLVYCNQLLIMDSLQCRDTGCCMSRKFSFVVNFISLVRLSGVVFQ